MEKLKKKIKNLLITGIIAAICLPLGVVATVMSAIYFLPTLGVGIPMIIFGFYGTPVIFTKYAENKRLLSVLNIVTTEELYDIDALASHLQRSPKYVQGLLQTAINQGYVTGLIFDGKKLTAKKAAPVSLYKCPNCGAPLTKTENGYCCSYCKTDYK